MGLVCRARQDCVAPGLYNDPSKLLGFGLLGKEQSGDGKWQMAKVSWVGRRGEESWACRRGEVGKDGERETRGGSCSKMERCTWIRCIVAFPSLWREGVGRQSATAAAREGRRERERERAQEHLFSSCKLKLHIPLKAQLCSTFI